MFRNCNQIKNCVEYRNRGDIIDGECSKCKLNYTLSEDHDTCGLLFKNELIKNALYYESVLLDDDFVNLVLTC